MVGAYKGLNMKIDDLLTLINAGYTKADIEQLLISANQQPEQPQPQPQPEQPQPQPEQPQPQPQPEQQPQPADDRIKQLETKLDYVINRFNYMSVQNSRQPEQKTETVDDILSSVIRGNEKTDKN